MNGFFVHNLYFDSMRSTPSIHSFKQTHVRARRRHAFSTPLVPCKFFVVTLLLLLLISFEESTERLEYSIVVDQLGLYYLE